MSDEIPPRLRQAHDEARKYFHAKAFTAAGAMCGRTLEAACAEHEVDRGSLDESLQEIRTRELVDGRPVGLDEDLKNGPECRCASRQAGNPEDMPITRQDAEDSLALNEALLDYLYLLSARFDAMKARRSG